MATTINAGTATGGAAISADTTGILALQSGSTPTTAITVDASQVVTFSGNTSVSKAQAIQFLNSTTGTNSVYNQYTNTSGNAYVGINNSTGGDFGNAAYAMQVFHGGAYPIVFSTSATERMRIDSSGNLLVGTTNSSIAAGNGIKLLPAGGGAGIATMSLVGNSSSSGQGSYHLYSSSLNQYQFYVTYDGTISARNTSINGLSDICEKTNIKDIDTGLDTVIALKPRRFDWKNGSGTNVAGFIAQEVETVLPELVGEYKINNEETRKSLRMGDILPTLVKAVQELNAKVDAQAATITALQAKVGA